MQGLGSMMMGGSAADGAPQPGAQGIDLGMLLAQMLGGKGGMTQQGTRGPLGQMMGGAGGGAAGGIPPQLLAMLSSQLGK